MRYQGQSSGGYSSTGYSGGGGMKQNTGASGSSIDQYSRTHSDVLDGMNAPSYQDRTNPPTRRELLSGRAGGYRRTGFGRTNTGNDIHNNFGYGERISTPNGGPNIGSGAFWQLRTDDRTFLTQDFIATNPSHIKRLQHILGRTPTGILDVITKQKYRAMLGWAQKNPGQRGADWDIYGRGKGNRPIGEIRDENKRMSRRGYSGWMKSNGYHMAGGGWRLTPPGGIGGSYPYSERRKYRKIYPFSFMLKHWEENYGDPAATDTESWTPDISGEDRTTNNPILNAQLQDAMAEDMGSPAVEEPNEGDPGETIDNLEVDQNQLATDLVNMNWNPGNVIDIFDNDFQFDMGI